MSLSPKQKKDLHKLNHLLKKWLQIAQKYGIMSTNTDWQTKYQNHVQLFKTTQKLLKNANEEPTTSTIVHSLEHAKNIIAEINAKREQFYLDVIETPEKIATKKELAQEFIGELYERLNQYPQLSSEDANKINEYLQKIGIEINAAIEDKNQQVSITKEDAIQQEIQSHLARKLDGLKSQFKGSKYILHFLNSL